VCVCLIVCLPQCCVSVFSVCVSLSVCLYLSVAPLEREHLLDGDQLAELRDDQRPVTGLVRPVGPAGRAQARVEVWYNGFAHRRRVP